MKIFPWIFLLISLTVAGMRYDCLGFVEQGISTDPMLAETRYTLESKKIRSKQILADAILPKFTFSMMVGPAPGLKETTDAWGDTVDTWDFTEWGPYWGADIQAIQPLNLGQYKVGQKAASADLKQQEMSVEGSVLKKEVELQSYYYNYLYAKEMVRLTADAQKQVDRAYEKMEEALDEDDESVSQMDLLKLKASMHVLKEGVSDAKSGLSQVLLAIRFSLGMPDDEEFETADTVLTFRPERMPTLEEVKELTLANNPDLKRLEFGLQAKARQVDLATAKLAPEFFIFGEFTYAKSWAGGRNEIQKDAFRQDAVNKISGAFGIGLRYRLNFWSGMENMRKSRTEYRMLKMKEQYAAEGTVLKAVEQYHKTLAAKEKAEAVKESLRASDAILKGAAMQYDLDPSSSGDLVSAYSQNVNLQKDYYEAVCKYNIALAELIARMGFHLKDYR